MDDTITPRDAITRLTEQVLEAKAELDRLAATAAARVQEAKDAANAAVQVAEEARFSWQAAEDAYKALKSDLQAALDDLDN